MKRLTSQGLFVNWLLGEGFLFVYNDVWQKMTEDEKITLSQQLPPCVFVRVAENRSTSVGEGLLNTLHYTPIHKENHHNVKQLSCSGSTLGSKQSNRLFGELISKVRISVKIISPLEPWTSLSITRVRGMWERKCPSHPAWRLPTTKFVMSTRSMGNIYVFWCCNVLLSFTKILICITHCF